MSVEAAVERDLKRLPQELAESALAASALAMAREIDCYENSATSKSMCQGRLQDALRELRELAPPTEEVDQLDDLSARRAARLAGGPKTTA